MIMTKKTTVLSAIFGVISFSGIIAAEKKAAEPLYSGTDYECKIYDRYRKDSGIMKLTSGDKTLIVNNRIYAVCKGADGKKIALSEKSSPKYEWENNILRNEKILISRNKQETAADGFAKINRKIIFSPNRISIEITVKNLKDITFAQDWNIYRETLSIVTASVNGMRISGILLDNQPIESVIPRKFDSKKWGFKKFVKNMKLTDSEQFGMTVTAFPNCRLLFNNYGGKACELSIQPIIRPTELQQKAGQETKFGCTLDFGQPE